MRLWDELPFEGKLQKTTKRPQIPIDGAYPDPFRSPGTCEACNNFRLNLGNLCIGELWECQETQDSGCVKREAAFLNVQLCVLKEP